jgi:hypothetical protein
MGQAAAHQCTSVHVSARQRTIRGHQKAIRGTSEVRLRTTKTGKNCVLTQISRIFRSRHGLKQILATENTEILSIFFLFAAD